MSKMLDAREKELKILQLDDEELEVEKNLFDLWPTKKVNQVLTDTHRGVKITLYDVNTGIATQTVMKRVAGEEFHINWDFEREGYMVGDEIVMGWDSNNDWLCYKVLPISAIRTHPQIANHFSRSFHPVE